MYLVQRWFFIVNPNAGGEKALRCWPQLQEALDSEKIKYDYATTSKKYHAIKLVQRALQEGMRRFVVVGGDGTVNEVVNGLLQQKEVPVDECVITVFPCGTGNDWAAYYGLPKKIPAFIAMLKAPVLKQQDVGQVEYVTNGTLESPHYFINFIGTGFDSYALVQMGSANGQVWRYFLAVLQCLHSYKAPEFTFSINGETVRMPAMMLLACLGRYGGAGMKLAPSACIDDGKFNVISIQDMPFFKRLTSLGYIYNGKVNSHPKVQSYETDTMTIDVDKPIAFQCDGEVIGRLPVTIKMLPRALTVAT